MSLFTPETMQKVFPEATPDTLQDPNFRPYAAIAEAYLKTQEVADIGTQAGGDGTHNPVAELLDPDDPERGGTALAELDPAFRSVVTEAHERTCDLFHDTVGDKVVPDLDTVDFESIDWHSLQAAMEGYEKLGMEAELVIAPQGRQLDWWQEQVFSMLRKLQDVYQPTGIHRLQNQTDGDGLWVSDEVKANWDKLADINNPSWTATVVPISDKPPVVNVDSFGVAEGTTVSQELLTILKALPPAEADGRTYLRRASVETYLTLQAQRIKANKSPVDTAVNGIYYYSWLDGAFTTQDGQAAAPVGYWDPVSGRVILDWYRAGRRDDRLGARPAVRG